MMAEETIGYEARPGQKPNVVRIVVDPVATLRGRLERLTGRPKLAEELTEHIVGDCRVIVLRAIAAQIEINASGEEADDGECKEGQ